ncbi:RHS repeat-associated core domain-containing protein [Amycolatopsis jejuensis]|uniref:RHS repeat-associated core domain-containing protein n=1 Tax=Amycolatopsis jejuensis TaxID=330084 RepID=UPI000526BD71|nr:RHS repeat-associated core domain-containing protein [Amycolatopsis jejuensis]
MSNPLIAPTKDSTTAYSGISLLEGAADLKKAIEGGSWASVAMGAVGTALDALSMALDPFGAILAAGVAWLMEHVGPLKEALNGLTGNADQIKAQAETWQNVAKELESIGTDLKDQVQRDLQSWSGESSDAYRKRTEDVVALLGTTQKGCEGAASGVKTAGEVVAAVRMLVRDIIAQLVGHMISWALQVLLTLGIGLAWVVPQVVAAVAKTAAQIAKLTTRLVQALKALMPLLKKAGTLFGDAAKALKGIKGGKTSAPPKPKDLPPAPKAPPAGKGGKGDDGTTTSSAAPPPPKSDPPPVPKSDPPPSGSHGGGGPVPPPTPRGMQPPPPVAKKPPAPQPKSPPLKDQGSNPRSPDNVRCEKDPIDVASGQMILAEVDAEFLGTLPLRLERTHFSGFRTGGLFGTSWMSTVDQRIEVHDAGVSLAVADGTVQHYPHPQVGTWTVAGQGPLRPMTRLEDGSYLVEDQETSAAMRFTGDTGALLSLTDRHGHRIDYLRDAEGTPVEVQHSAGYRVRVTTSGGRVTAYHSIGAGPDVELVRFGYTDGRLTEVVNPSGAAMQYAYDDAGRIVSWTDRNGEWYRYHYDPAGRVVRTEGSGGFLSGTMEYDTDNRITRSVDSLGHTTEFRLDETGQLVAETDPLGNTTQYAWDAYDHLLRETDPLGRTTSYTYDGLGALLSVTAPDGARTTYERNEFGSPVSMTAPSGLVKRWEYDEDGNLLREIEPDGATITRTYDARGVLTSVTDATGATTRIESDASGLPLAVTDARGGTTRYDRDRFGRIVAITTPAGAQDRFGYTVDGRLAWHRDADGALDQWTYDGEGNARAHTDAGAAVSVGEYTHFDLLAAENRADGTRVSFGYDTERRLTTVTNEQGLVWHHEYDAAGNLVRETDFGGVTAQYRYDAAGQLAERTDPAGTSTFRYDLAGNVVEHTAGAVTTQYSYDPDGRLTGADDGRTRVTLERDAAGRITVETVNGRTIRSAYDAAGRRIRRQTPSGAESTWDYAGGEPVALHAGGRTLRFDRDAAGREIRRTLDTGVTVGHAWSPAAQLLAQTISTGTGQPVQKRAYHYRPDGHLGAVRDQLTGPREFTLDGAGRVTGVQSPWWTERYTYDPAGNLTDANWPTETDQHLLGARMFHGNVVAAAGTGRYVHDERGRMVRRELPGAVWQFSWGPDDRLTDVLVPDGTRWHYTYDPFGRRIAKEHFAADGVSVLERVDFTWDNQVLVEQATGGRVTAWDYEPDSFRPLLQRELALRGPQEWVDERFSLIVPDLAGAPAELVGPDGRVTWYARTGLWGTAGPETAAGGGIPLRFQGQYHDAETGLHYNLERYYDPALARYLSPDPIRLDGGPHQYAFAGNPHAYADPLGLAPQSCSATKPSGSTPRGRPDLKINTDVPGHGPSWYDKVSPAGKYKDKPNRVAAGYGNPGHMHGNMIPLWAKAAKSPLPPGLSHLDKNNLGKLSRPEQTKLKNWLSQPNRRFDTKEPGQSYAGKPGDEIVGHSKDPKSKDPKKQGGVLGHDTAAGTDWNKNGMKRPRAENVEHNKQTGTYHGIESNGRSSSSGSKEDRYQAPGPHNGARPEYWNRDDPGFKNQGGPWPSYKPQGPTPNAPTTPTAPKLPDVPDGRPPKRPRLDPGAS